MGARLLGTDALRKLLVKTSAPEIIKLTIESLLWGAGRDENTALVISPYKGVQHIRTLNPILRSHCNFLLWKQRDVMIIFSPWVDMTI
ncbi:MAG: hypothetical protein WCK90_01420 [archaeon]